MIRAAERIERILHDKATMPERPPSTELDSAEAERTDADGDGPT